MRNSITTQVFFSSRRGFNWKSPQWRKIGELADITIVIHPTARGQTRCKSGFSIYNSGGTILYQNDFFFAFLDKPELTLLHSSLEIKSLIQANKLRPLSANKAPRFFSLLPNIGEYRLLVGAMGAAWAKAVLLSLKDLVACKSEPKDKIWYKTATESWIFRMEFMLESQSFFAFQNAHPILKGLGSEQINRISSKFRLKFKLDSFMNEHDIPIEFDSTKIIKSRICVIIGKNGVGKSQTLFHFAKSLLHNSDKLRDMTGERPSMNRLIAVSNPGETRYSFPKDKKNSRIDYRRLFLGIRSPRRAGSTMGDLLVQLARTNETIKGQSRWELFVRAISRMVDVDKIYVKTINSIDAVTSFPLSAMMEGNVKDRISRWASVSLSSDVTFLANNRYVPLSSGQLTFMRFAAQACLFIENGTIFLFDEPEIHLHPNLITEFISLLSNLLDMTGSLAILATHSAYFVREVPRTQVIILERSDTGEIAALRPRLRTLGANVGEISHFVFGDPLMGRLLEAFKDLISSDNIKNSQILSSLQDELSTEAWMNLRNLIAGVHKK